MRTKLVACAYTMSIIAITACGSGELSRGALAATDAAPAPARGPDGGGPPEPTHDGAGPLPSPELGAAPADVGTAPPPGADTLPAADAGRVRPDRGSAPSPDSGNPPPAQGDAGVPPPPSPPGTQPAGPDTATPYPIDSGDLGGASTPGSYQSLWLRLVDNGTPTVTAVNGVIGVVCIGMSNSSNECSHFIGELQHGTLAGQVAAAVKVVNCAVGGHAIEKWNDPAYDGTLWEACISAKLPAAGVQPDQVRVLYHKAANMFTTGNGGQPLPLYPDPGSDYANFYANLSTFAQRVKSKLPAVQAVYTTSRSYGGFSTKPARGEPLSYEEGHALNAWLADHPSVDGAWYGWGPYIWAPDCATGVTNASGVCYVRSDYVTDGVHPATGAKEKITSMIHARFLKEAWYQP